MDLPSNFQVYIEKHSLWQVNERLLLAFSGGIDSTILAHLLLQTGADFGLAHVNYRLREEADDDEAWCRSYAAKINKPFYSIRFDTPALHAAQGGSVQALARNLRYEWLETIRIQEKYSYIVVAHHQDDALETLLLNLLRGTGIRGLKGILPRRGLIRRPLLFASRKKLEDYAHDQQLTWREDASNSQLYYTRNKIRHQLLPLLRELQPGLDQRIGTTLQNLQSVNYFYQLGIEQELAHLIQKEPDRQQLEVAKLLEHQYADTLLHEWLSYYGFSASATADIIDSLKQGVSSGSIFLSNTHALSLEGETLCLYPHTNLPGTPMYLNADQPALQLPDGQSLSCTELALPPQPLPDDPSIACLDVRAFQFPVLLRRWKPGDRMAPLGMGGQTRKLQDLFSDAKWSKRQKAEAWVLESQGNILWIPYLRLGEQAKIQPDTSRCILLRWHSKPEISNA
jgi:tRNA(Ile)-lysidine synthase